MMTDDNRTRAMGGTPSVDPNKTRMGAPPSTDPNKTVMGAAPTVNTTVTIKPVQCPVCKAFNPPGIMFCNDCGLIFEKALDGDAFGAPSVKLPCLVDQNGREHQLRPGPNVVGRQGDILIEDTRVSRRHAHVILDGTSAKVEDLGSTNGTKVGGQPLAQGQQAPIESGAVLSFGGYEMTFSLPGEANKTQQAMSGRTAAISVAPTVHNAAAWLKIDDDETPLEPGKHTFGRRTDNDIVVSDPYVSGRHGVFEVDDSGVYVTDTGSTNGTVLNDAKIAANQRTQLQKGDVIKLGDKTITVRFKE
ncbi:MAG TPA: FHA domain-containing protein [Fimbriimonadaceae bacterium]|nr:FHA domain-containing protein [Fimbriimonadaceae bacterium]